MKSPGIWPALAAALPLAACGGLNWGGSGSPPAGPVVTAAPPAAPAFSTAPPPPAVSAAPLPAAPAVSAAPPPPATLAKLAPPGATLSDADHLAAFNALAGALDSGQRKSWRGAQGVFGFIEPGSETGGGCRAYSQTVYIAGRPSRTSGTACKQADGAWLPSN